jgi:hypothetical protein
MMQQAINSVLVVIIWGLFVFMMAILVWGMDKGFDFSDEGFSMLSLTKGQEQGMEIRPFFMLFQKLFSVFSPGVVFYRLLRLILLLTGTAVFVTGLISYFQKVLPEINRPVFGIAYPVAVICGLSNYSIFFQSLSYNSLTLVIMLFSGGFLLKSLSLSDGATQKRKRLFLAAIGLLCGILFLIKLPSGILFSAASLFILFTGIPEKKKLKSMIETMIVFISGFIISLLLLYVADTSPAAFAENYRDASQLYPAHQFSELLEVYRDDLHKNFLEVVLHHKVFLVIPLLLWLMYRLELTKMFVAAFAFSCLLLIKKFIDKDWYKAGMEGISTASMVYILLMWSFIVFMLMELLFFLLNKKNKPTLPRLLRLWPVFLLLFFSPFIASAGTNNPFSIHITQFLLFWMVMFLLIIEIISDKNFRYRIIRPLFAFLLIFMVSTQFLFGYIRSPYRMNQGLNKQTCNLSAGTRSASLLLDNAACSFVNSIMRILKQHGYQDGNYYALSLYSYPGLVYLSGAFSPGAAWYFSDGYEGNDKANCYMISKTKIKDLSRTVIFLDSNKPVSDEFSECLKAKGILFPENYFCADSVLLPDASGYLKIYLPD